MIRVTRLNGEQFALNPDLIERVEAHPDTVAFLVDGTKYVVAEPFDHLLRAIQAYRALAVVAHQHLTDRLPPEPPPFRVERRQFSRDGDGSGRSSAAVPLGRDEA